MGRISETILPLVAGIIISVALLLLDIISYENSINIIKEFPVIGTCSFGFLLTMFSLIVQGNNKTTDIMRQNKRLFSRFVALNRGVVLLSLFTTIFSYIFGNMKVSGIDINCLNNATAVFYCLFIAFIITNIYFLIIFYMLLKINNTNND